MSEARRSGRVVEITSLANPLVKDIKALALKKHREETGAFLAEGLKLVIDALDQGWTIRTFAFAKSALGNALIEKTAARARAAGATVIEASAKVLEAMTRRDNPQTVIAVFAQRYAALKSFRAESDNLFVALDRVRDPGNLGTIIRTADAAGAKGVILVGETTDPFGLETVRATMGSVFAVPVARASEAEFIAFAMAFGGQVVGAHLKGAIDFRAIGWAGKSSVLLMGNEQQGLTDALANACSALARIPQAGKADSLNLAVATGVMLFEARRHALTLDDRA